MEYRQKPIIVEAVRFDGFDFSTGAVKLSDRPDWLVNQFGITILFFHMENTLTIKTPKRNMLVFEGDWIIKGANGKIYPCKSDIFQETYEINFPVFDRHPNT